jgi:ubiquinol-cytochrome c reductase iron-sulfur subunit
MSTETEPRIEQEPLDVFDPRLTRFDIMREGARREGIEIVHYEAQFPPNSRAERRMVRIVASFFLLTGLAATAFLVIYTWGPWEYELGSNPSKLYTPLLGLTLGVALLGIGFGILTWGKKLLPREVALGFAALLGLAPVGAVAAAPLIGGLIKDPVEDRILFRTGWDPAGNGGNRVRVTREDGSPIRPEDVSVGGQMTVFPGIPGGATNEHADSPTLLIHLRPDDAQETRDTLKAINRDSMWQNFVAYSKICTHAGCPASLYEQQTNRLLCPCHQSQFLITDNARPIFGPATRSLPMLPIEVDGEGFFVAKSDYKVAVGPAFWERP